MGKNTDVKGISLCPSCGACPQVIVEGDHILIGEEGNSVKLAKGEWNELVRKIRSSELKEV